MITVLIVHQVFVAMTEYSYIYFVKVPFKVLPVSARRSNIPSTNCLMNVNNKLPFITGARMLFSLRNAVILLSKQELMWEVKVLPHLRSKQGQCVSSAED